MKIKLEDWNKFLSNLKCAICILAKKRKKTREKRFKPSSSHGKSRCKLDSSWEGERERAQLVINTLKYFFFLHFICFWNLKAIMRFIYVMERTTVKATNAIITNIRNFATNCFESVILSGRYESKETEDRK